MNSLISGLSLEAIDVLKEALNKVYGEDIIEIVELNKTNVRQRVHLGSKEDSIDTVLIVLDIASFESCKDMDSVSNSDKIIIYEDVKGLVNDLQSKYNITLSWEDDNLESVINSNISGEDLERLEKLENIIADKDLVISNLSNQVKELEGIINYCDVDVEGNSVSSEEISTLNKELLDVKSKSADIARELNSQLEVLKKDYEELSEKYEKLKESRKLLVSDFESVSAELTDYKVKYSTSSGLLKSKDKEIESLKSEISDLSNQINQSSASEEEVKELKNKIGLLESNINSLNIDIASKSEEISRLNIELNSKGIESNQVVDSLKSELEKISNERDKYKSEITELSSELLKVQEELKEIDILRNTISELKNTKDSLEEKLGKSEETIIELNKEKIEIESKISVLEKSTNRDTDVEAVIEELNSIRRKYNELNSSIYSRIAELALPTNSLSLSVVKRPIRYDNIHFVFSGSAESRKGMYKCLYNKVMNSSSNILIVDVVSETSIDYVFQIKSVVKGINWFISGGGVSLYLSNTVLKNTFVLSPGLSFINDSYFLAMDWDKRLQELNESGYEVYVVCGDISNMIGRVLHESFSDCGDVVIYVHGNANGCRTVITNTKGLSKSKDSEVLYYEFNPQVQKLYDIMNKTHKCSILSGL